MSVSRAQKVRLGIFVATGLTLLIGGIVVLAGMKLGEQRDTYLTRFSDSKVSLSGLEVGSPVKYSGIRVGRVETIRVDPEDVGVIMVSISLDHDTPVAEDTKASLGSLGITGLKYIELTRGSRDARVRDPGEEIPAGTSAIDDLANQAGEIAEKVSVTLDQLNALTGPDMKRRIAGVLDRTDRLLETLEATIAENRPGLKTALDGVSGTASKIETLTDALTDTARSAQRLFDGTGPAARSLLNNSTALVKDLRGTTKRLDRAIDNSNTLLGPEGLQRTLTTVDALVSRLKIVVMQTREEIVESIGYMRQTAENMSEFSERIREEPSLLLLGDGDGEAP